MLERFAKQLSLGKLQSCAGFPEVSDKFLQSESAFFDMLREQCSLTLVVEVGCVVPLTRVNLLSKKLCMQ